MTLQTGNKRSNHWPAAGGSAFTLVELLLVMTILVVVIGLALPTLSGFFRGRVLNSEARQVLALVRHGQARAVFEGVPMLFWVDDKNRSYGLEEESSYADVDPKAVEFTLHEDLSLKFASTNQGRLPLANTAKAAATKALQARSRSIHRSLQAIRFQPDGSLDENSPQSLVLADLNGGELWVTQSVDRLSYEIRSRTNSWDQASR